MYTPARIHRLLNGLSVSITGDQPPFLSYTSLCIQWILESWDSSSKDDSVRNNKQKCENASGMLVEFDSIAKVNLPKFP